MEGVRQEVREVEGGEQGEEKRSHEHEHVDGMKDSLLEPRCMCARCDVLTHKKKRNSALLHSDMWKSVKVVMSSLVASCVTTQSWTIVNMLSLVSASCIVTTHSRPILNFHFWSQFYLGPNFNL